MVDSKRCPPLRTAFAGRRRSEDLILTSWSTPGHPVANLI